MKESGSSGTSRSPRLRVTAQSNSGTDKIVVTVTPDDHASTRQRWNFYAFLILNGDCPAFFMHPLRITADTPIWGKLQMTRNLRAFRIPFPGLVNLGFTEEGTSSGTRNASHEGPVEANYSRAHTPEQDCVFAALAQRKKEVPQFVVSAGHVNERHAFKAQESD
jgi:hypothetical protein